MKALIGFLTALIVLTGCDDADHQAGDQIVPPLRLPLEGPPLFVVKVDGKAGFINSDGEIAIEPVYQKVYPFRDGLAAVQSGGLWGFIDTDGNMVIKPQFIMIGFFSEGLAAFRKGSYQAPWGYVDKTGAIQIAPQFDEAGEFRNGIARVGFEKASSKLMGRIADVGIESNYRFIDQDGNFVEEPPLTHYATGKADELLIFKEDGLYGYADAEDSIGATRHNSLVLLL